MVSVFPLGVTKSASQVVGLMVEAEGELIWSIIVSDPTPHAPLISTITCPFVIICAVSKVDPFDHNTLPLGQFGREIVAGAVPQKLMSGPRKPDGV
jgi:hypothetical protein